MEQDLLQQVYHRYRKEIYVYLFTFCKNKDMAEDLLQETFLKAILSLPDSHSNVRAWLYMVARNLYYNSLKGSKRLTGTEPSETIQDNHPGPEETVMKEFLNQTLYQAIQKLDDIKREIILLQYFSGFSQKEIAALLGLSPEYIRVLVFRAKKELKKYMKEYGYDIL